MEPGSLRLAKSRLQQAEKHCQNLPPDTCKRQKRGYSLRSQNDTGPGSPHAAAAPPTASIILDSGHSSPDTYATDAQASPPAAPCALPTTPVDTDPGAAAPTSPLRSPSDGPLHLEPMTKSGRLTETMSRSDSLPAPMLGADFLTPEGAPLRPGTRRQTKETGSTGLRSLAPIFDMQQSGGCGILSRGAVMAAVAASQAEVAANQAEAASCTGGKDGQLHRGQRKVAAQQGHAHEGLRRVAAELQHDREMIGAKLREDESAEMRCGNGGQGAPMQCDPGARESKGGSCTGGCFSFNTWGEVKQGVSRGDKAAWSLLERAESLAVAGRKELARMLGKEECEEAGGTAKQPTHRGGRKADRQKDSPSDGGRDGLMPSQKKGAAIEVARPARELHLLTPASQGMTAHPRKLYLQRLPAKYVLLEAQFRALETTAQLLHSRAQPCTVDRVKGSVENLTGRRFTLSNLAQLCSVLPSAIHVHWVPDSPVPLTMRPRGYSTSPQQHWHQIVSLDPEHADQTITLDPVHAHQAANLGTIPTEPTTPTGGTATPSKLGGITPTSKIGGMTPPLKVGRSMSLSKTGRSTEVGAATTPLNLARATTLSEAGGTAIPTQMRGPTTPSKSVNSSEVGGITMQTKMRYPRGPSQLGSTRTPSEAKGIATPSKMGWASTPPEAGASPTRLKTGGEAGSKGRLAVAFRAVLERRVMEEYERFLARRGEEGERWRAEEKKGRWHPEFDLEEVPDIPPAPLPPCPPSTPKHPTGDTAREPDVGDKFLELEEDVGCSQRSAEDEEILRMLPTELLKAVRVRQRRLNFEHSPAAITNRQRRQSLAALPDLLDEIQSVFRSAKRSAMGEGELQGRVIKSTSRALDRAELSRQMALLLEHASDWLSRKTLSSGATILRLNTKVKLANVRSHIKALADAGHS